MKVRVSVLYETPGEDERNAMQRLGRSLTDNLTSVSVYPGDAPDWLTVEFTMPKQSQDAAIAKIERDLRYYADDREDSVIDFPKSEAEKARARLKAERRNARRRKEK